MAIKLGVVGLGLRLSTMLKVFRKSARDLKVTALLDQNSAMALEYLPEEERGGVQVYETVDDLVRRGKVDALAIGTRCNTHTPFAIEAAKYDLPLFLEKPVSVSLEQARALEKAFAKSRCQALVSFPLRASKLCARVKRALKGGAVGRVEHILGVNYVNYGDVYFQTAYRDYKVTQGLFLQKATHDFDYLSYLAGAPIVRVAAMMSRGRVFQDASRRKAKGDPLAIYCEGIGTPAKGMNEDSSSALLEFENGAKGVYTQVFFCKRTSQRGATISGALGTLAFDWYKNEAVCNRHREPFTERITADGNDEHFGGDLVLAENFAAMIKKKAKPVAPIWLGIESAFACLAAKESAETGKFVQVQTLRAGGKSRY